MRRHNQCARETTKHAFLHCHFIPCMSRWSGDGGHDEMSDTIRSISNFQTDIFEAEAWKLHVYCDHVHSRNVSKVRADQVHRKRRGSVIEAIVYLFDRFIRSRRLL